MIRDRFQYHAPDRLDEATALLAETGDQTEVIGGGTWVVPEMTRGLRRPAHVLDLGRLNLSGVAAVNGHLEIGPRTTYSMLERDEGAPGLLRTMASGITGGAQLRNQATVGGSACYANPASDVPGVLLALDAVLRLASAQGERDVAAADFFRGAYACERRPDELLTAILVPTPAQGTRYGYHKFKLVEGSWPIVTAACVIGPDDAIRSLVIGGAAATPVLVGIGAGDDLDAVAELAGQAVVEPWSDVLAPGKYRKAIAGVIANRALAAAQAVNTERPI